MSEATTTVREALVRKLPDIPRWLEARSLLLSEDCEIFGFEPSRDNLAFVVSDPDLDPICVIGCPDFDAITKATSKTRETTVVLCSPEDEQLIAQALPGWHAQPATLHTLNNSTDLPDYSFCEIRFVTKADLQRTSIPSALRAELQHASEYSSVAAVFVEKEPVSFCYAGSQSETLWDISIDTLESSRRRGYGAACVAFLIEHMRGLGKEPVWGALESNEASLSLAQKLGFTPVDQLIVFEKNRDIPVIDVSALLSETTGREEAARKIGEACREHGFFYIRNHGISEKLQSNLELMSRAFFAQDSEAKIRIHMSRGGRAWRGYFPVGEELTSGVPDLKEGIYFGQELSAQDPRVGRGLLMHGGNLFPEELPQFREVILEYMTAMTELGQSIVRGISLSLGLSESYFSAVYTADPFILFRIFNYPASDDSERWGVAEHTDYGLLTILKQDSAGGLEVKVGGRWIPAPPIEGTLVCNIGDMLDKMTGGRYRSTPHRVKNTSGGDRLSFPFFFDPSFDARVKPIFGTAVKDDKDERWDQSSVHDFTGTYGDYLLAKVEKVFPLLKQESVQD